MPLQRLTERRHTDRTWANEVLGGVLHTQHKWSAAYRTAGNRFPRSPRIVVDGYFTSNSSGCIVALSPSPKLFCKPLN